MLGERPLPVKAPAGNLLHPYNPGMFQRVRFNRGTVIVCGLAALALVPVRSDSGAPSAGAPDTPLAAGELSGRVEMGRNRGVAGATVLLTAEDAPGRLALTSTNGHGAFRFEGLEDGRYRLDVRRPGFTGVTKDGIVVRRPYRAIVDLTLLREGAAPEPTSLRSVAGTSARLRGRVRTEEGTSPTQIPLQLRPLGGEGEPRTLRTDPHGEFDSGELAAGLWELQIRGVGWLSVRADLDLNGPVGLDVSLVRQPADYEPSPLELMPPELPLPPDGAPISSRLAR